MDSITKYLQNQTKQELISMIRKLTDENPDIAREFNDRLSLVAGNVELIVARTKREIGKLTREFAWYNPWERTGHIPDYSPIRKRLRALLDQGYADEVLSLGLGLIQAGSRQVESSDDEGETASEISACIPLVVEAMDRSSLSPAEKLMKAIDLILEDRYDLCTDFQEYLKRDFPEESWSDAATYLVKRLSSGKPRGNRRVSSSVFERRQILGMAIRALASADRGDEILPLCEREAERSGDYLLVIDPLIQSGNYRAALEWVQKGIRKEYEKSGPDIELRGRLQTILTGMKDWPTLALHSVEEFVLNPEEASYIECERDSRLTGQWEKIRLHLLAYLESGLYPWEQKGWPLPPPGRELPEIKKDRRKFPATKPLVEIAIREKEPALVLKWYDTLLNDRASPGSIADSLALPVAEAVKEFAPDRALAIWKRSIDESIERANATGYTEALFYLKKMQVLLEQEKRSEEWDGYLSKIREVHSRKIRLMEFLDRLEKTPPERGKKR